VLWPALISQRSPPRVTVNVKVPRRGSPELLIP
jgi:hypothetical protein